MIIGAGVICWGQSDWMSTSSPDTTYILIHADLIGASWTFNHGGTGAENTTAANFLFSVIGDTLSAAGDTTVRPCDVIHKIFWIENTGGVTLDFNVYIPTMASGPDWIHDPTNITCITINRENVYGGAYAFEPSDGDSTTPSSPSWNVLPDDDVGTADEFEDLLGEDPSSFGDGTWTSQTDQRELHLKYVMPISSTTTAEQRIYTVVVGKISD